MRFGKRNIGDGLRLTDKRHPAEAVVSTVFAIVSFVFFVTLCIISGNNEGKGSLMLMGLGGMGCMLLSVIGFILAFRCLKKDNIRYAFVNIGSIGNGILVIMYMILYALGVYL